jgi:hypothetical protein
MSLFDRHAIQSIVAEGGGVSEAIAPALRNLFDDVTAQPVPASLAALVGRLDTVPNEGTKDEGTKKDDKEEGEHGPSTTQAADRVGRGG